MERTTLGLLELEFALDYAWLQMFTLVTFGQIYEKIIEVKRMCRTRKQGGRFLTRKCFCSITPAEGLCEISFTPVDHLVGKELLVVDDGITNDTRVARYGYLGGHIVSRTIESKLKLATCRHYLEANETILCEFPQERLNQDWFIIHHGCN